MKKAIVFYLTLLIGFISYANQYVYTSFEEAKIEAIKQKKLILISFCETENYNAAWNDKEIKQLRSNFIEVVIDECCELSLNAIILLKGNYSYGYSRKGGVYIVDYNKKVIRAGGKYRHSFLLSKMLKPYIGNGVENVIEKYVANYNEDLENRDYNLAYGIVEASDNLEGYVKRDFMALAKEYYKGWKRKNKKVTNKSIDRLFEINLLIKSGDVKRAKKLFESLNGYDFNSNHFKEYSRLKTKLNI